MNPRRKEGRTAQSREIQPGLYFDPRANTALQFSEYYPEISVLVLVGKLRSISLAALSNQGELKEYIKNSFLYQLKHSFVAHKNPHITVQQLSGYPAVSPTR